jgi:hypothetical protein
MSNQELVERYAAGADVLSRAIVDISRAELNSFPVPGTWSLQQIVAHMMDSDLIASDRMKRIIAEEEPTLIAYNETAFSQRLHYDKLDAAMCCEVFRINRILTAAMLRELPDEAFLRVGRHNEVGPLTLGQIVNTYCDHLDHHMVFLRQKRELLGKPLGW